MTVRRYMLALGVGVSLTIAIAFACAMLAPTIPMAECDARCGTAEAEALSRELALEACDELVAAELSDEITPERCRLAAVVANSCRTLCR